jgi:pyridoxal phosphate enzyme (YggS family)
MTTIAQHSQAILSQINNAALAAGRNSASVTLVAVSKTHQATKLREAYSAGLRDFGESYVQEALEKMQQLADLAIVWHFIGPIQSNKTRLIAENFSWVHGVDRLKIAQRLADSRPHQLPPLNVCLQVNISGEVSKAGCSAEELPALAHAVNLLPNLKLRGLMTIPEPTTDIGMQRQQFGCLRRLLDSLNGQGLTLDTLSMGMSGDFVSAIMEGSTMVRIGTAIFGQRPTHSS